MNIITVNMLEVIQWEYNGHAHHENANLSCNTLIRKLFGLILYFDFHYKL